jgi:3-hydroxy-9,10-secoandrosta-1,3,5(10)-triene-9,17-dione monooxygenase reductase component
MSSTDRVQLESEAFRRVLSHFPTGVAVITGMTPEGPAGLAVGSFTSVSLVPRMVGFFVDRASTSWPSISATGSFCANILAADQADVCRLFARSGGEKFAGLGWRTASSGSPVLDGVLAWIDCKLELELQAGDHRLVLGVVLDLAAERHEQPLVFHRGTFPGLDLP